MCSLTWADVTRNCPASRERWPRRTRGHLVVRRRGLVAQRAACCLVGDFIRVLYSFLTPPPPAIVSCSAPHIPSANAFFYRSLPSSSLATVSDRSIRNAGLPAVPPPLCGRCSWEVKRLRLTTFGCLLWFDLWGPHAAPYYWRISVAIKGDSDVARSYCCSALLWTYRVSMTAGMFAVDEALGCTSVTSAILWSDKHRRLVESLSPPRPPVFSPSPSTVASPDHFSLARRFALILFSSYNFPIFQTLAPPSPTHRPPYLTLLHSPFGGEDSCKPW